MALAEVEKARNKASRTPAARPRKANRGSLPAHLERIEQLVDVKDRTCSCCGGALHAIGEDVSERLDVEPITFQALGNAPPPLRLPLVRERDRSGAGSGTDGRRRHSDRML